MLVGRISGGIAVVTGSWHPRIVALTSMEESSLVLKIFSGSLLQQAGVAQRLELRRRTVMVDIVLLPQWFGRWRGDVVTFCVDSDGWCLTILGVIYIKNSLDLGICSNCSNFMTTCDICQILYSTVFLLEWVARSCHVGRQMHFLDRMICNKSHPPFCNEWISSVVHSHWIPLPIQIIINVAFEQGIGTTCFSCVHCDHITLGIFWLLREYFVVYEIMS